MEASIAVNVVKIFNKIFNKIATQGAPQMAVDKEANSLEETCECIARRYLSILEHINATSMYTIS